MAAAMAGSRRVREDRRGAGMIDELRSYTGCLALLAFVVVAFGGVAKACIFAFDWLFG